MTGAQVPVIIWVLMFEVWKRTRTTLDWMREQRQGSLGLILSALRLSLAPESSLSAAAISYFALFSFFPILVFTTVIAGTWLEPILDKSEIIEQLDFIAPALAYLLDRNLQRIVGLENTLTGLAIISLLWSSSNIFYVLTRTLDRVWGVVGRRSFWRHRGMAILSVLIISAVLLLASIVYSSVVSILSVFAPSSLRHFGGVASQLASLAVSILLFAVLYRYLPHVDLDWIDIWPGAVGAGLLWEVAKRLFFFYATHYMVQTNLTMLIYGSVATIIAFLGWSYVSSLVFMFGAYLNVGYCERKKETKTVAETLERYQSGVPADDLLQGDTHVRDRK